MKETIYISEDHRDKSSGIYFGGKIYHHCWRSSITIPKEFYYAGPRFVSCDHGCYHGPSRHGAYNEVACNEEEQPYTDLEITRDFIFDECIGAIKSCDIFFAWIEEPSAFGTLFELGYAHSKGKYIALCFPSKCEEFWGNQFFYHKEPGEFCGQNYGGDDSKDGSWVKDYWFAIKAAKWFGFAENAGDGFKLFESQIIKRFASPAEATFYEALQKSRLGCKFVSQHPITLSGRKIIFDFALPEHKFAIEIDGYTYHKSQEKFNDDRLRDRIALEGGWTVARFSAQDVMKNSGICVKQVEQIFQAKMEQK